MRCFTDARGFKILSTQTVLLKITGRILANYLIIEISEGYTLAGK